MIYIHSIAACDTHPLRTTSSIAPSTFKTKHPLTIMVRTQQHSRDGLARFPPRHKGHFWFENRVGKRQALNGKFDREDQEIMLASHKQFST